MPRKLFWIRLDTLGGGASGGVYTATFKMPNVSTSASRQTIIIRSVSVHFPPAASPVNGYCDQNNGYVVVHIPALSGSFISRLSEGSATTADMTDGIYLAVEPKSRVHHIEECNWYFDINTPTETQNCIIRTSGTAVLDKPTSISLLMEIDT